MKILQKLVCKSVKDGDYPLKFDDTWTDCSSEAPAEAGGYRNNSSRDAVPGAVVCSSENGVAMENETNPEIIVNYKVVGLCDEGDNSHFDDISDELSEFYIVDQVRKSLKPQHRGKNKSSSASSSSSSKVPSIRIKDRMLRKAGHQTPFPDSKENIDNSANMESQRGSSQTRRTGKSRHSENVAGRNVLAQNKTNGKTRDEVLEGLALSDEVSGRIYAPPEISKRRSKLGFPNREKEKIAQQIRRSAIKNPSIAQQCRTTIPHNGMSINVNTNTIEVQPKSNRHHLKKAHFAPKLEERITVPDDPYFPQPSLASELIQSPSVSKISHRGARKPSYEFDANSIGESVSTGASGDSQFTEESMETMELCFNHITCSSQDRVIARDWLR